MILQRHTYTHLYMLSNALYFLSPVCEMLFFFWKRTVIIAHLVTNLTKRCPSSFNNYTHTFN